MAIFFNNFQIIFWYSLFNGLYFSGLFNCMYSIKKNLLSFLIAAEVMFLGLDLGFIGVSVINNHPLGIIYSLLILVLAVGESAVGLSLCVVGLKLDDNVAFSQFSKLKY